MWRYSSHLDGILEGDDSLAQVPHGVSDGGELHGAHDGAVPSHPGQRVDVKPVAAEAPEQWKEGRLRAHRLPRARLVQAAVSQFLGTLRSQQNPKTFKALQPWQSYNLDNPKTLTNL
eukprot:1195570-Prorocentrum_minimum.AAC.6